jgi:CrcB protein
MDPQLQRVLAIAVGGALGAVCRYAVVLAFVGKGFPYGVLAANIVGCFLLGIVMHDTWVDGSRISLTAHAALSVGVLGALTTFSTFGYDTLKLMEEGRSDLAAINVIASVVLGLAACGGGRSLGNNLWPA